MTLCLETDSVGANDRVDWWRERTAALFGAEYSIDPGRKSPFSIRLNVAQAAPLVVFSCHGSVHHAVRKCDAGEHPSIVAHLQLQGHSTVRTEGKEVLVGPGVLTFNRVSESSDLRFHEDYRQVCAVLPESAFDLEFDNLSSLSGAVMTTDSGIAALLADHLHSLAKHPEALDQESPAMEIASYTIGLLRATARALTNQDIPEHRGLRSYHLGRIKRFVLAHLHHPGLGVEFISAALDLSARYIHRLFEEEAQPLMRWVMKQRLERAREQLAQPGNRMSVAQTGYAWGFNDHAHFSRSFRKEFGYAPRDARAKAEAAASD
jgi:AraC-like DNA-binding protein